MTNFTLGQQVTNFGMTATVVGFHKASGSLILEAPGTGRWMVQLTFLDSTSQPSDTNFQYSSAVSS